MHSLQRITPGVVALIAALCAANLALATAASADEPTTGKAAAQQEKQQSAAERMRALRERMQQRRTGAAAQQSRQRSQAQSNSKAKGSDCGKTTNARPVPNPEGPQPKFVCETTKVELDPLWRGTKAVFPFDIRNDGEGPLQIQLKGG